MNIVTVGIDLAKNVFALHGVDQSGKAVFIKPKVVCGQLLEMVDDRYLAQRLVIYDHFVVRDIDTEFAVTTVPKWCPNHGGSMVLRTAKMVPNVVGQCFFVETDR